MVRWIELNPGRPGEAVWRIKRILPSLHGSEYEAQARSELARLAIIQAAFDEKEAARIARNEVQQVPLDAEPKPPEAVKTPDVVAAERARAATARVEERRARLLEARRAFDSLTVAPLPAEEDVVELTHKEAYALESAHSSSLVPPRVAKSLLGGKWDEAERLAAWWQRRAKGENYASLVDGLLNDLESLNRMDERILKSFESQIGTTFEVHLVSGITQVTVDDVAGRSVKGIHAVLGAGSGATERTEFGVADLSVGEKLKRMGEDEASDVALAKGLLAYQYGAYKHARHYFSSVSPLLSEALLQAVDAVDR